MTDQTDAQKTEMDDEQTADNQQPNQAPQPTPNEEKDWKAEAEKWKALSRQNEERFKAAATELDGYKQANMTDAERAIEEAKQTARKETLTEVKTRLAKAELKSAASDAGVKVPAGIDKWIKFDTLVDDEGKANEEAIAELVSSFKPAESNQGFPQIGLGPQGDGSGPSLDYSPDAIAERVRKRRPY